MLLSHKLELTAKQYPGESSFFPYFNIFNVQLHVANADFYMINATGEILLKHIL